MAIDQVLQTSVVHRTLPLAGEINRHSVVAGVTVAIGQMLSPVVILNACMGLFLIPVTTAFNWTRTEFTLGILIQMGVLALLSPFTGGLMDRYGVRWLLLPGMALLSLMFMVLAVQPGSLLIYYGVFVVIGICAASTGPVPCAKVISGWFHVRRGTMLALTGLGLAFASILLPILLQALMNRWGWRSGFAGLATLVGCVGLPILWRFLKESPFVLEVRERQSQERDDTAANLLGSTNREAIRTLPFWLCLLAVGMSVLVNSSILSHAVAMLGGRGVPVAQAFGFVTMVGAGMGIIRFFEGSFLDCIDSPRIGILFSLMSLSGLLLLQYSESNYYWVFAGFLLGMGAGGEASLVPYFLSRFFGIRSLAQIFGSAWACAAICAALGPVLMSVLFDHKGSYELGLYIAQGAMVISAVCFLVMPAYRFEAERSCQCVVPEPIPVYR